MKINLANNMTIYCDKKSNVFEVYWGYVPMAILYSLKDALWYAKNS